MQSMAAAILLALLALTAPAHSARAAAQKLSALSTETLKAPSSCSVELAGWQKHENVLPRGSWEGFSAESAAACAAACSANSYRCAAFVWNEAGRLPHSDSATCQFVTELRGLSSSMPGSVDLYTPCFGGCGAVIPGFEKHRKTFPMGTYQEVAMDSAAACTAACAAGWKTCVAAVWQETKAMPDAVAGSCFHVEELTGFNEYMPEGVDLYMSCVARSYS